MQGTSKTRIQSRSRILQIPRDLLRSLGKYLCNDDEVSLLRTCKTFSSELSQRAHCYFQKTSAALEKSVCAWNPLRLSEITLSIMIPGGNMVILLELDLDPLILAHRFVTRLVPFAMKNEIPIVIERRLKNVSRTADMKLKSLAQILEQGGLETDFARQFAMIISINKLVAILEEQRRRITKKVLQADLQLQN